MPDERLPAISISLNPTDNSSSCWVGHRLVVADFSLVFFLFILFFRDIVPQFHCFLDGIEFSLSFGLMELYLLVLSFSWVSCANRRERSC